MSDGSAAVAAHEGVRGTGGQSEDQRNQVPGDRTEEAGEEHLFIHHFDTDHPLADGLGHRGAENEGGDEIPESCPDDGAKGRQDASGDDGGDGIGGVVLAVRKFEGQGEKDNDEEKREATHGRRPREERKINGLKEVNEVKEERMRRNFRASPLFGGDDSSSLRQLLNRIGAWAGQALLRMTPSMTLATSSHLSTAVSMTSKISFHLMIWTGSCSSSKSCAMSVRHKRSLSFSYRLISMQCFRAFCGVSSARTATSTSAVAETRTWTRSRVPLRTLSTR